jgi:hypothetical protein
VSTGPQTEDAPALADRLQAFARDWQRHQTQEEAHQRWTRWVSTTLVGLVALTMLTGQRYTDYSNATIRALNWTAVASSEATTAWQRHENRRVRAYLFQLHRERLDLDRAGLQKRVSPDSLAAMDRRIARYAKLADEHWRARTEQLALAQAREKTADKRLREARKTERHVNAFSFAVTIFQIAIAFTSLALILRRHWPWYVGLVLAGLGLLQVVNSELLLVG